MLPEPGKNQLEALGFPCYRLMSVNAIIQRNKRHPIRKRWSDESRQRISKVADQGDGGMCVFDKYNCEVHPSVSNNNNHISNNNNN